MSLREITDSDLKLILEQRNHPDVRSWMFDSSLISEESHHLWFSKLKEDSSKRSYIYQENDMPLGIINFSRLNSQRGAEWGFYAFPNATRGTGTKLAIEALDKYFLELNGRKLNAEVLSTNTRSIMFHLKLGFVEDGKLREAHLVDNKYVDIHQFGILKDEWLQKRKEFKKVLNEN